VSFILMIMVATTVTYAWLSMATSNVVKGLELRTNLGDELEISLDGINYYQSLPTEILINHIGRITLTDITSLDGKNFNHGIKGKDIIAVKNEDYISLSFHFRTSSLRAHQVFIANNVSDTVTYENTSNGTFIVSKGR